MVTRFGMSDLGPLSLEGQTGEVFLGRDLMTRSEYSEEIAARIDGQVRELIQHAYEEATRVIQENRPVIDRLVDLLIDKKPLMVKSSVKSYLNTPSCLRKNALSRSYRP